MYYIITDERRLTIAFQHWEFAVTYGERELPRESDWEVQTADGLTVYSHRFSELD